MTRNSSQGSNVRTIRDDDRRFVEGPVTFVRLSRDVKPSLLERIADLIWPRMFVFYAGFWSGAMFCCGMLILWARVL